jgi:hypothetical protein
MPISAIDETYSEQHWQRVKSVLEKAILDAAMTPQPVWENQSNDVIQARILKNVYENDLVVCDVSARNPNVMLELGMRLSTKKPTILVADDCTALPFDTSVIAHSFYPRDLEYNATSQFVANLSGTIRAVMASFARQEYVSFVDNFRFETVVPSTVQVSAERFFAERLDEVRDSVVRIEKALEERMQPTPWPEHAGIPFGRSTKDSRTGILGALTPPHIEANPLVKVGSRVFHSKFGYGTVTEVEGAKLEANFDHAGTKRVMHSFVSIVE